MARKQKFNEDILLEAVVKYSEISNRKIKATELARWARKNIFGLEEVQDYHFLRPIKEKDSKTGKTLFKKRLCTERIEEINKARNYSNKITNNILLQNTNIDDFYALQLGEQRELIVATRQTYIMLKKQIEKITIEKNKLEDKEIVLDNTINELLGRLNKIEQEQKVLRKRVSYILSVTDEEIRKVMYEKIGIKDNHRDLEIYLNEITKDLEDSKDIIEIIKSHSRGEVYQEKLIKETLSNHKEIKNNIIKNLFE